VTDTKTARALTLALCSAGFLTACGGGGSSSTANGPDGTAPTLAAGAAAPAGSTGTTPQGGGATASQPEAVSAAGSGSGTQASPAALTAQDAGHQPLPPGPGPRPATAAGPSPSDVVASPAPAVAQPADTAAAAGPVPTLGDCQLFPANAIFNTRIDDVSRFPAHPDSGRWIDLAGRHLPFGADWGFHENQASYGDYYGMPVNVIDRGDSDWPVVSFDFSSSGAYWERGWPYKSDCAVPDGDGYALRRDCTSAPAGQQRFPFPHDWQIVNEDGQCNDPNRCGDRHVLVVEKGECRLWESFFAYKLGGQWYSLATAAWDLKSNALRPRDWASADAAGLPMAPLLVKVDEADAGEIRHALRVNFRDAAIDTSYLWPARFAAGGANSGAMPFGALLRLKQDFAIPDGWTTQAKAIAKAAKRYGMYVADNGGDFHVQGAPSARWQLQTSLQLKAITMNDMEFVDLRSVTGDPRFSPDSMAASW